MRKHGNVHVYGEHWHCYDFKTAAGKHCASARSFKISDAKVLEINSDRVGFEPQYSGEFCYHSLLKRGKKQWETFKPALAPKVNCVKEAKKADVLKLLEELGASETVRTFYENALADAGDDVGRQDLEESSDEGE